MHVSCCALRYNWLLVKPLVLHVLDSVLQDFDAESKVEVEQPHIRQHMCVEQQQLQAANCKFGAPDWASIATCQ